MRLGFTMAETQSNFFTDFVPRYHVVGAQYFTVGQLSDISGVHLGSKVNTDNVTDPAILRWNNALLVFPDQLDPSLRHFIDDTQQATFGTEIYGFFELFMPLFINTMYSQGVGINRLYEMVAALAMRINEMERKPQNVMEEWMLATGGKR
jgi:hypothetical protein